MADETNDLDGILAGLLKSLGVEDVSSFLIVDIEGDNRWTVLVDAGEDLGDVEVGPAWSSPGQALDYVHRWASARGLIVTSHSGLLRRWVSRPE